jgi:dihydroorotase
VNCILRGVRVIDPLARLDTTGQDVWIEAGRIIGIYRGIRQTGMPVVDLTPAPGRAPCVLCPGFIDLHAHLREPGDEAAETIVTGARAGAAGGFTHLVAMANTKPPVDTPDRVARAIARAADAPIDVLQAAAMTAGLEGNALVDIARCIKAGAVAISDDGRNAASPRLLARALRDAARSSRPVLVHPEDEEAIAQINATHGSVALSPDRPPETEARAVDLAIRALAHVGAGRLHLQHISTADTVEAVGRAKQRGLALTAEVTPHHLGMWQPVAEPPDPHSLLKVNPPLRTEHDRTALIHALRDGTIDAVATDHAPRTAAEKAVAYADAAPGMVGLETALAMCLTLGAMGEEWLPTLVERLTAGPYRVLGASSGIAEPRLRIGEDATCTLFDPDEPWVVGDEPMQSGSRNTPLLGVELRGRVLLTIARGRAVYHDAARLQLPAEVVASA